MPCARGDIHAGLLVSSQALEGKVTMLLPNHLEMTAVLCTGQGRKPRRMSLSLLETLLGKCCFTLEGTKKPSVGEFLFFHGVGLLSKFR